MILGQQNFGLEGRADNIEDSDLKNRAKYIHSWKDCECLQWVLREQSNLAHNSKELELTEVDMVII